MGRQVDVRRRRQIDGFAGEIHAARSLPAHNEAGFGWRQAGARAEPAVHRHQTIVADAHAAIGTARLAALVAAGGDDAVSEKRRRDGFPGDSREPFAFELDFEINGSVCALHDAAEAITRLRGI